MSKKIILKASAGTGKTYRLSLEYIKSLILGIDFKEILVMTFTRKATSEIKERILGFLSEICTSEDKKQEIEANLQKIYGDSIKIDDEKIKKIYKEISENRDKLKIYTIDGFTNMIFKKSIAPYLKIYSYEIVDDEENSKILNKTFQKLFENKDAFNIFKDFLSENSEKNMDNYIKLINGILSQRWKLILFGDKINKSKEKYDCEANIEDFDDIFKVIDIAAQKKKKNFEECIKGEYKEYLKASNKEKFLMDNFSLVLDKEPWNRTKIRSSKTQNIDEEIDRMTNLYEGFKNSYAKVLYNNLVLSYEDSILKTLETIYSIYDEIKFREKRFTHLDISNYTFKYLQDENLGFINGDGALTDDFFEMIDCNIKSIFIDEFQDTSILQWKILKNIIDRCENIICVGDEKQSIYGWRGGEKKLFENLETILEGETQILDTCYRSRENIVNYANKVFKSVSKNCEFSQPWSYIPVNFVDKEEKGSVEVVVGNEEEDTILTMVEKIEKDFAGEYNGIGIIARTKKILNNIAMVLANKNIPYTLESDKAIVDSPSVAPIYWLIRWLVRGDYLSLLDFFRSDLIGISSQELQNLIEEEERLKNWLESEINEDDSFLYVDYLNVLKRIYQKYKEVNGQTECLMYLIIKELGVLNVFDTKEDTRDIYEFYRLLKKYRYFSDFIEEIDENAENNKFKKQNGTNSGIRLLTIHKSKGLEFETVYYYIPKPTRFKTDGGMKIYFSIDSSYTEVENYLITHSKFNKILDTISDIVYLENEKEKEAIEEINNLYVALTRPKKNLVIVIEDEKMTEDGNIKAMMLDEKIGELTFSVGEKSQKQEEEFLNISLCNDEKEYKLDIDENNNFGLEKIKTHTLAVENKRVRGNIVHFFLENLENWEEKEIEIAKKITFTRYSSVVGNEELLEILSDRNILIIKEKCKELFSEKWDYIYREYPIYLKNQTTDESETVRLDRVMIKKSSKNEQGIIFIADYKTGSYDEAQLRKYETAIKTLLNNYKIDESDYEIKSSFIELAI